MTVDDIIYMLGIPGGKGHKASVAGIELIIRDPNIRDDAMKRLYPEIAQRVGNTPENVARNIATAINRCWTKGNRNLLNKIARYELQKRPAPVEFMEMIAVYMMRHRSKGSDTAKV